MKIREHRGLLADSMETVREIEPTKEALFKLIKESFKNWPTMLKIEEKDIHIKPYHGFDDRIGWDTYRVTIDGYGVFGFTDGGIKC